MKELPPVQSGPRVWYGPDMATRDDWIWRLNDDWSREIAAASEHVRMLDRPLIEVGQADFPLPTLGPALLEMRREVVHGRGFALLRGLDISGYDKFQRAAIFWGLGQWIGSARSQNGQGHLLGHVCDLGYDLNDPNVRIYQTTARQTFHTDSCDIVALMCLRKAKSGGLSSLVSASTVYNEFLSRAPELAKWLFVPVATDRRGEVPPGQDPWFNVPVLSWYEGELTPLYQRQYVDSAQDLPGAPPLTPEHIAALDLFDRLCDDPDIHLAMDFEPGDMQFVCNHVVLHDRTAYTDWPEPEKRRHLLRLWLSPPVGRPLPPDFAERYGSLIVGDRGGIVLRDTQPTLPLSPA